MKNRDLWKSYAEATRQASSNVRWLAGMLLASVLYKIESISLSVLVLLGLLFAVLIVDIVQYGVSAWMTKRWTESEEKKNLKKHGSIDQDGSGKEIEYDKPQELDRFPFWCWIIKIVFFLIAVSLFLWILSGDNIN